MIKTLNKLSLYTSILLTIITVIGYILGITIICASLLVLFRTVLLTVIKIIMYFTTKVCEKHSETKIIAIMIEESWIDSSFREKYISIYENKYIFL